MSVTEIGFLHGRYVRLSDRFKAVWTFNQFASGVYKNLIHQPVPYRIDFQRIYDSIRSLSDLLHTSALREASAKMDLCERETIAISIPLVSADDAITPPVLRRFLDMLKQTDEKIIFNLVKFYLYSDAVTGDRRDKLDFLFTKIGENFATERGTYWGRDSYDLRKQFQSMTSVRPLAKLDPEEVASAVRTVRELKDAIQEARDFDDLTRKRLLESVRELKHKIGDLYFQSEVLIAIVDCNLSTKSRFEKLYREEEQRILEDSQRLEAFEGAIRGESSNNALIGEIDRFRLFKQEFDDSLARKNLKHNTVSQLRASMTNILAQLERGLEAGSVAPGPLRDFLQQAQQAEIVQRKFGADPLVHDALVRIIGVLDTFDPFVSEEQVIHDPRVIELRMEPWEVAAYRKLYSGEPLFGDETEEMMVLLLRAAALRLKMDEEARTLIEIDPAEIDSSRLEAMQLDLDYARDQDRLFGDLLEQGIYFSEQHVVHRMYRSRFRLLRAFSGLWLLHDQLSASVHVEEV